MSIWCIADLALDEVFPEQHLLCLLDVWISVNITVIYARGVIARIPVKNTGAIFFIFSVWTLVTFLTEGD